MCFHGTVRDIFNFTFSFLCFVITSFKAALDTESRTLDKTAPSAFKQNGWNVHKDITFNCVDIFVESKAKYSVYLNFFFTALTNGQSLLIVRCFLNLCVNKLREVAVEWFRMEFRNQNLSNVNVAGLLAAEMTYYSWCTWRFNDSLL